jgi:hypothetical protein
MDDGLQRAKRARVGEDDRCQGGSIDRSVSGHDARSEPVHDGPVGGPAGIGDPTSDVIRVDHGGTGLG